MSEALFIRLGDSVEWFSANGTAGSGTLEDLAEALIEPSWQGEIIVLVRGEQVLLTSAVVPSRDPRQIIQAVPFLIEEELAMDVDSCHFAVGAKNKSGETPIAVIALDTMRQCLTRLGEVGIKPDVVTTDTLLAFGGEGIAITLDDDRAHLRTSDGNGFTVPASQLAFAVDLMPEKTNIDLFGSSSAITGAKTQIAQIEALEDCELTIHEQDLDGLPMICRNYSAPLNLLQGEFQTRVEGPRGLLAWRWAAVLAVCTFLLHLSVLLAEGIYLDLAASRYESEARSLYQEVFPGDRNVRDVRRRWQAHVSGSGGLDEGQFLQLFQETAVHLPGSRLVVNNINYNESRGDLILQLTASQSDQLVLFSETLQKVGLIAEIGTISQEDNAVRGSIKVRSFGGGA